MFLFNASLMPDIRLDLMEEENAVVAWQTGDDGSFELLDVVGTRIPGLRRSLEGVPTLVLWGEGDRYLGPELLDGLETLVPDLRLVRIPEASHWLPADAAERVNAELIAFLR